MYGKAANASSIVTKVGGRSRPRAAARAFCNLLILGMVNVLKPSIGHI